MNPQYDAMCYPHSMHRRYVRGCEACLQRSRAGARRLTESRRRAQEQRRATCTHVWALLADDTRVCEKCFQRTTL